MSARHQVRLYNTAGQLQSVFDSWRSLQVQLKINNFSECTFEIDKKKDRRWQLFTTDSFVEVLRNDQQYGIPWRREYIGFHRTPKHSVTEAGNEIFTSYGRSIEDLLSRRGIAYQTGSGQAVGPAPYASFTHKLGPADDVMKAYVLQNIGTDADNPARFRSGVIPNFLVADNVSLGPTWEGDSAFSTLRELLINISESAEVDFSVGLVSLNPPTFVFNTHFPILGTDRTLTNPPVILSPDFQNIKTLDYTVSRTDEVNVAVIVGSIQSFLPNADPNLPGQLIGSRHVHVVQTIEANASPWNDIELIKDERNATTEQALLNKGDEVLASLGPRESFIVTPLVGSNAQYGRDYFFGDRVIVRFGDVQRVKKVVGVNINSSGNDGSGEQLSIELGDVSVTPGLLDVFRNIANRLSEIEHKGDL